MMLLASFIGNLGVILVVFVVIVVFVLLSLFIKWYRKPIHGRALVRSGAGGTKIAFENGFFVIPVLHRMEIMDITLKTITISRIGGDGLICQDNIRADIKVAFFIRVNNTFKDAKDVAFSIGCERASAKETLESLFDAKFSEALKTVGKQFDFVDLYNNREDFRKEILNLIGRNLNGYFLDDCAIDYLEQTPLTDMKEDNILDAEGIKKIIDLTSAQQVKANLIENEKRKTITKQDVEAQETILQYERQLAEKEETQKREIANIKDKQQAAIVSVAQEQRLISEKSTIEASEAIEIAQQNKERQVIVATWNKERADAVEGEKVEKDRSLQITDREKIVSLAQIEKDKEVELEKAKIQEIIRERVMVEKDVVVEQEKIKDTEAFAGADRSKRVAITNAEKIAEEALVKQIKNSEANLKSTEIDGEAKKVAAEYNSQEKVIDAEAKFAAAGKESEAIKTLAEAEAAKSSAQGKAEAQVIEAKALANLQDGETIAKVLEMKALAEAKGVEAQAIAKSKEIDLVTSAQAQAHMETGNAEAKVIENKGLAEAEALNKKGEAEANVLKQKGLSEAEVIQERLSAEAKGIDEKAAAMKKLDGVGKEHEEFKLQLQKDKDVEIAEINIWKDIAQAQATVIAEALKAANIDIVGGETMFFEKIIGSITRGKSLDSIVSNSDVLTSAKNKFLPSDVKKVEKQIVDKVEEAQKETKQEEKKEVKVKKPVAKKTRKTTKKPSLKMKVDTVEDVVSLVDLSELELRVKDIIEKYKFMVQGVVEMKISEVLDKLMSKVAHDDVKELITILIGEVTESGIGDVLVKTLGVTGGKK
ncbi:MAG: flotillin family protein [Bacteroidota bacterium]